MLFRGDTCLIVYQKAARIERTRWLFDVVQNYLLDHEGNLLVFLIVLPTADPPDAPTRQENSDRTRVIGHRIRKLITIPIGNTFKVTVVRTIMHAVDLLLGNSATRSTATTVDEGLAELLDAATERTPPMRQIRADIADIYLALGEPVPRFPSIHPAKANDPD